MFQWFVEPSAGCSCGRVTFVLTRRPKADLKNMKVSELRDRAATYGCADDTRLGLQVSTSRGTSLVDGLDG